MSLIEQLSLATWLKEKSPRNVADGGGGGGLQRVITIPDLTLAYHTLSSHLTFPHFKKR